MARVAYVDHSYHRRTRATMFLVELLRASGNELDLFWDESWASGKPVPWKDVASHDVVVMFQPYCPTAGRSFRSLHPNVVYVPMFDQFGFPGRPPRNRSKFWKLFAGSKVLSFSTAVHALATGFGVASKLVHYYPEVPQEPARAIGGLHGFFWLRREREIGWNIIRSLIGSTQFDSFHIHAVGDPGFPPIQVPLRDDMEGCKITVSSWFDDRSDFERIVDTANVFFAPRCEEGIGQAFLEAMSRGQCVVAADRPTMNEYIVHGVNGLLYDPGSPEPLDFSDVVRLGSQARRGIVAGRTRWLSGGESLVDFILTPSQAAYDEDTPGHPTRRLTSMFMSATRQVRRAARSISGE